jgi:hypothetical protein
VPSTFTVTNLFDTGAGSLRAAVAAANANPGADAIDFAVTGIVGLTSGQLDITDSVTINGPGAGALTVSGNYASRVFGIAGDPTVTIANLTVANGATIDSPGGGISVGGGAVTLDHVTVSGNYADGTHDDSGGSGAGGGIAMAGGTVTLNQVTVSGNYARGWFGDSGGSGAGGGLYVAGGILTLDQCTVSGNYADGGSAVGSYGSVGNSGGWGTGGGLYVAGGLVHVNQSTVTSNVAVGGDGTSLEPVGEPPWTYGGNGGSGEGGGIYVAAGKLEVGGSTLSGNAARGGYAGYGDVIGYGGWSRGGGLYIVSAVPPLADLDTFTLSNTINNVADVAPNISGPYYLNGMPLLAISDVRTWEGNTGTLAVTFTVSLSAASNQTITVNYATASGTATTGSDYQAASGTLTIPAGQTSGTVTVLVKGDRLVEANETFFVNLSGPTNVTIADGQAVGTIFDDEPRISISDATKSEGKKGKSTQFTFTVTLSAAYDQPVTMSFRNANGTATTSDNDYVAKTGTITFKPGETTKTITIEVKGDSKREADETFYLDLFGLSGNTLFTKNRGIGTILNDD